METKLSKNGLLIHLIFWIITIIFCAFFVTVSENTYDLYSFLVIFGYYGIINILFFYTNYLILIPFFIEKKQKIWWYISAVLIVFIIVILLKFVIATLHPKIILQFVRNKKITTISYTFFLWISVFTTGFLMVISSLIKFSIDWFSNVTKQRKLEIEKRAMELQFLKSQLNPHFLFNSLNNIYSLAYQKSDKTADAILKLSEIMRYMLYESNDNKVNLNKEIEYLHNFIELQRLRFKEGIFIDFKLYGEIDKQQIVPLMLISFVENAFKHGIVNDDQNPIKIGLTANQKILHFTIKNKKNKYQKDKYGGVGLSNLERRLQITYPEKHRLNIINSKTHYTIELMLNI